MVLYGPFTEYREAIQQFRDTGNSKYLYRNKLDKDCCAHDAREPFQIRLRKIEVMQLLEIVSMMDIKEH